MFNHVVDARLRSILANSQTDEDSICYALTVTRKCLEADVTNEDVNLTVLDFRIRGLNEASSWWNDEGNAYKALQSLQLVWNT